MKITPLQQARLQYQPKLPGMLRNGIKQISVLEGEATCSVADQAKIKELFPNTYGKKEITFVKGENTSVAKKQVVGVILSGGQAPGGHNVVCGLYDALKATNKENVLLGFKGGPSGLLNDDYLEFDDEYTPIWFSNAESPKHNVSQIILNISLIFIFLPFSFKIM